MCGDTKAKIFLSAKHGNQTNHGAILATYISGFSVLPKNRAYCEYIKIIRPYLPNFAANLIHLILIMMVCSFFCKPIREGLFFLGCDTGSLFCSQSGSGICFFEKNPISKVRCFRGQRQVPDLVKKES